MRSRTQFSINLSILADNVERLRRIAPHNRILFMVKANAYGHGMVPIVKFAVENLGINEFGCATMEEARVLRQELPQHHFDIYVFSDVQIELKKSAELYLNHRILPVLSSLEDLEFVLQHSEFKFFPLCLKFNTGMNRLGIALEDVEYVITLLRRYERKEIFHLFSHFASASHSVKNKRTVAQLDRFNTLKQEFIAAGIDVNFSSISNSGAIEQEFGLEHTHIRPGLMLYGPSALAQPGLVETPWQGELIGKLETYVIRTFDVVRGMPIGYGGTPTYDDGKIALLALGYGDGIPTYFQKATLYYREYAGRVLGRVNMDMLQLFFSQKQNCPIKGGDAFVMWGHDPLFFTELCQQLNVIPYELLCQLTSRIPRIYTVN